MRSFDNVFEYNQHFVAMMNIINAAKLNPPTKGHKHTPSYFKGMKWKVVNNKRVWYKVEE